MKNIGGLLVLIAALGLVGNVFAQPVERPCGEVDLCTWSEILPLGSPDIANCGLFYNTYWFNTEKTVTCSFDGSSFGEHDLYISIDNDVIECMLNGEFIFSAVHEGCAPLDPRNGYNVPLANVAPGTNNIVCRVLDRGVMSHFDACVVGSEPIVPAPEFGSLAVAAAAILSSPAFAYLFVRRRRA